MKSKGTQMWICPNPSADFHAKSTNFKHRLYYRRRIMGDYRLRRKIMGDYRSRLGAGPLGAPNALGTLFLPPTAKLSHKSR